MKRFTLLLVLLLSMVSCKKDDDHIKSAKQLLPLETHSVIVINDLNDFTKSIENQTILSHIYHENLKTSTVLKHLNTTKQVYVGFLNHTNTNYLVVTENDSTLIKTDSTTNHTSNIIEDLKINKVQIDSTVFFHKTVHNCFVASNNPDLLSSLKIKNESDQLSNLIATTDNASTASLIFKKDAPNYSKLLLSSTKELINNDYTVLDLNFSEKDIKYNGIITSGDSITHYLDCFKNTIPQKNYSINIAPHNTNTLNSITYDDFSVFNNNLNILKAIKTDSSQTFLNYTNEVAVIDNAVLIHSLDADIALETIERKIFAETYRDIDIFEFGTPDFFESRLQPFITFKDAKYLSKYNDFLIFSNSEEHLKSVINSILSNTTIANLDAFKNLSKNISNEASMLIFKNNEGLSQLLNTNTKGYDANIVQYIHEDNYTHVNGSIKKYNKPSTNNSVIEAFTVAVDAPIITPLQTVKNHITKTQDIIVQDANNVLYLISSSGNILWKKELQGKVLGKVEQIDIYKNGRLQLAFATANRLYVLDRNGNDIPPFPRKFNDAITQPLSVFDYDKRKNYRLLVTQGKNLLMYDAKGKAVKGFKYASNGFNISTQPKHFRIDTKDYIVFATNEQLKILNRQGKIRVNTKDKIRFSKNELYLHNNKFTSTNTLGQLVQVNTQGKLNTKTLHLLDKHHVVATNKTLVSMTENKLQIKSRGLELDYGEYTPPKIFYVNNKIYVTTTDLQSKKVYLYNSLAKPISGFPVFGTSSAELQKLDKEKGLELITQTDDKTIIIYKLH